ncbi:hypothetical protein [Pseudanabaena sp. FACHB-2040]|uniref:hypothetical protein n=1 Tax=Pseudanabaena sp. FACHB-2040 TaxID=2692859 RepID=UPI001687B8D2|nr:hypothetical protein [Pseudanabaena sp. FACHB-2040]MBD2259832.1 hypothetical protein [Pseudanabaena sp. FACHB-2040]
MPPLSRALLLFPAVSLLAACGNQLNTAEIESAIKADIERQGRRLTLQEVRCPTDITRQTNGYFRCVGELKPEGTFTINVVQTDSNGTVEWDIPNSRTMLNLVKVENQIQEGLSKALSSRAPVDCGSEAYRVNQAGERFECQIVGGITAGSDQIDKVLVRIDADGNLNWQEVRQPTQPAAVALSQPAPAPAQPTAAAPTEPASSEQTSVKTTTVSSPTGRVVERPYVRGDAD